MSKLSFVNSQAKIKVVGCGGAGCNAITHMVRENVRGVEFVAMNTDAAHLEITEAPIRILIGEKLTRGLGAGGDHTIGRRAAEDTVEEIKQALSGADMVFIAAGMGGGTGTGSIGVVADISKHQGSLTIATVTKPFGFEGKRRAAVAEQAIIDLAPRVDTLVVIPNDKLLELSDSKTNVNDAFKLADDILFRAVEAVAEVITVPGMVNLDFADVRSIMKDAGLAWMSVGRGSGTNRAANAAKEALSSPLLDISVRGAMGVLFNITGGPGLTLFEVRDAAKVIGEAVDPSANIIFGVHIDQNLKDEVRLTLIATGFAGMDRSQKSDQEITKTLKGIKSDEELEIPSYTRFRSTFGNRPRP